MSKILHCADPDVSALADAMYSSQNGWAELLKVAMLDKLSTSGSGAITDATELFAIIEDLIDHMQSLAASE